MKFFNLFICSLLFFFSCKKEESVPQYVLPKDKMIEVLVRMELKQAEIKYKMAKIDSIPVNRNYEFEETLRQFDLTFDDFNKNLSYYCAKPTEMHEMYIKVIAIISEEQVSQSKNKQ